MFNTSAHLLEPVLVSIQIPKTFIVSLSLWARGYGDIPALVLAQRLQRDHSPDGQLQAVGLEGNSGSFNPRLAPAAGRQLCLSFLSYCINSLCGGRRKVCELHMHFDMLQ